jgi:VWFA-related protein
MTLQKTAVLSMLAALAVAAHPALSAHDGQQQQQVPVFRSAITLVPIDVRVVDKSGRPITDLKQEEFTVTEDDVKQEIRHLSLQTFAPAEPAPGAKLQLKEDAISFEPQSNRIFLIVLGRGKLQEPSRAIDALLRFVREKLLPQDQLAIFAYNRATTFTTDHEQIARVIERFRKDHEQIDYEIELQMSGLAAIYGAKLIPRSLQGRIDRMFEGSGLLASQRVDPGAAADKRISADSMRQSDAQIQKQVEEMKAETSALAGVPNLTLWSELDEISTQMFSDLSLEAFVAVTAQTLQDLGNIYAGVNYLKHFEGEKHLVFFTERGLTMPRLEEDQALAAAANDARVALDTIETGGLYTDAPSVGATGVDGIGGAPEGAWNRTFAFKVLRNISEFTGGVSSIAEDGMKAIDRINDVTRATYVLGYYPTNSKWDGAYRKVEIKVSRPGATVYYRHGYYGRKELFAFNRREFITNSRVRAAAGFRREITDIRVKLNAAIAKATSGSGYELNLLANIDPSKLAFTFVEGVHVGRITIGLFFFDDKDRPLGNGVQSADLKLKDADYKKIVASGIPYGVTVPINPGVRRVRAVVYDFKADLIGSADAFVR